MKHVTISKGSRIQILTEDKKEVSFVSDRDFIVELIQYKKQYVYYRVGEKVYRTSRAAVKTC